MVNKKMKPDAFPESSHQEEINPERTSYMDLIINELACIKIAIEKIDEIITEPTSRSELKLNYEQIKEEQIKEIKRILDELFSYAVNQIEAHRQKIDWNTITDEIQSYVEESNIYNLQRAIDPNLQLKTLLLYIFERLTAALTHAGNLYNTQGANALKSNLNKYKTEIDRIYKSLSVGLMK
ncbi:MAG: hypothetical protein RQ894_01585 [Candidatus Pacebacteria bacterium]|nr:hypothetical protein [Candidatus Paceibacterota bacterium]